MPRLRAMCNSARSCAGAASADFVLIRSRRSMRRLIERRSPHERFAQRSGSFASVWPNQKPHQSSTVFGEVRGFPPTGYFVACEIGIIDRALFDVTQFWLRHMLIAWLDFQRQARARERNLPRRFFLSPVACQQPRISLWQFDM